MNVAILVPVLDRPRRVAPLLRSIDRATPSPHRVLFIASPDDWPERDAIIRCDADCIVHDGNYAAKIRAGVDATAEPLLLLGADDLDFRPGWLDAARAHLQQGAQVVGVNDLIRRRPGRERHATHFLVTREYALQPCIDGSAGPLCALYDHSFADDELIATAMRRGVYAYAEDAVVAHLHPMNGTAPDDATYRKGRARYFEDRTLFRRRRRQWLVT